ncbi:MAG: hypothetical protein ACJASV_003140 [Pseudorhodobacter sp.]|jgi:hypothetical protein
MEDQMDMQQADPKGLVRESYLIEGITAPECRSIFVDWALSLPVGVDTSPALEHLIAVYTPDNPDHPMNAVLSEGLQNPEPAQRRGGRAGRLGY